MDSPDVFQTQGLGHYIQELCNRMANIAAFSGSDTQL